MAVTCRAATTRWTGRSARTASRRRCPTRRGSVSPKPSTSSSAWWHNDAPAPHPLRVPHRARCSRGRADVGFQDGAQLTSGNMPTLTTIAAAGATDAGLQREVNEDRFHVDQSRGLFIVIDGVGGQAAGGKAADVALCMLRERLERETGPVCDRVREAITVANNEIHRLASTRPEWEGMACVLTVAVIQNGTAMVGHVGDTRLYKIRDG